MSHDTSNPISRRKFFAASSAAALTVGATSAANAETKFLLGDVEYEITRTEAEWREILSPHNYQIMRDGYTELPKSSGLWKETADGLYHCKGCDLEVYDSKFKTVLDKGWVFFLHAQPDSVLLGIDESVPAYGTMSEDHQGVTEVHCRRCGSHLGHFLTVEKKARHCINGAALVFKPTAA